MKKQSGITLIALVITIVVLLILAGVSISAITGDEGVVSKAKEAASETEKSVEKEEDDLDGILDFMNNNESSSGSSKDEENEIVYTDFVVTSENRNMIGYTDSTTNLIIPEVFQGGDGTWYKVIGIGEGYVKDNGTYVKAAFEECTNLVSITLPESVTYIEDWAFGGCSNLTNIKIPNSITSIGEYAFGSCESLRNVTLPSNLKTLGEGVFASSGVIDIAIPNGMTIIPKDAFNSCNYLKTIVIPSSVTTIGEAAFSCCTGASTEEEGRAYVLSILYKGTESQWNEISIGDRALDDGTSGMDDYMNNFELTITYNYSS